MKKSLAIILCLLLALSVLSACGGDPAVSDPSEPGTAQEPQYTFTDSSGISVEAKVASEGKVMVDGKVYIESDITISDYLGDMNAMRTIESFVDLSETPTEDGQSNFDAIGAPYIIYGEGLAVFLDDVWIYFMPME